MASQYQSIEENASGNTSALIPIVVGPPGSGKETQCKRIAAILRIPHISIGNLLRVHISQLDRAERQEMARGQLISDELVLSLLIQRVSEVDCSQGFILDGFPRTLKQAQLLDEHLRTMYEVEHHKIVLELVVSSTSIRQRISRRLVCPVCGSVSSKDGNTSVQPTCAYDRAVLVTRDDDCDDVVMTRWQAYEKHIRPILSYYCSTAVVRIDAEKTEDVVTNTILQAVSYNISQNDQGPERSIEQFCSQVRPR